MSRKHKIKTLVVKCRRGGEHVIEARDVDLEGDDPGGGVLVVKCPGCGKQISFEQDAWPKGYLNNPLEGGKT